MPRRLLPARQGSFGSGSRVAENPGEQRRLASADVTAEGGEILRFRVDSGPRDRLTQDHDDFGLMRSKIMNVIDSKKLERDRQISLRNLREPDCAGKAAQRPAFPHPALDIGYIRCLRICLCLAETATEAASYVRIFERLR
jgi:hypothetical protein